MENTYRQLPGFAVCVTLLNTNFSLLPIKRHLQNKRMAGVHMHTISEHFISSRQLKPKKMPTQCALNSSIKWQLNSCEQHGPLLRFKVSSFTPHIVEGQKILNHKSNNQQCPKTSKSGFKMKIKASGWELSVGGSTQTGWKSSRSLNLKGFLFKQKQKSCDQNPNTNVSQEQPTENAKACKKIMFQRTSRVVPNLVQVRAAQYF